MNNIELVLEELLMNAALHAYPKEVQGEVEIGCATDRNIFILSFTDWGIPFNPLTHVDPDLQVPLEEREIGGLGIMLVKKLSDRVEYRRERDKNVLTVRIRML